MSLSPTSLSFSAQVVNTTSSGQAVTLSNTGNGDLTISSITISGSFAGTSTCGSTLDAYSSCAISVTFTPTAAGSSTGSVKIIDNATGSPHTLNLTGTGTTPEESTGGSTSSSSTGSMVSGTGAPTSGLGDNGDLYHRTDVPSIYGPKANGAWPSTYSVIAGQGCTTPYHIDKDCDGYGVGPTEYTTDPNPLLGPDADDNDAAVNTPDSVISKYGTISAFLSYKGYPTNRVYYISNSGNNSTGDGSSAKPYASWGPVITRMHDGSGGTVMFRAGTYGGVNECDAGYACYNPIGSSSSPVVVMAYPGESVVFDGSPAIGLQPTAVGTSDIASNVIFDGMKLFSPNNGYGYAMRGNGYMTTQMSNITLVNAEVAGWSIAVQPIGPAQNFTVDNSVFHDEAEHCIYPVDTPNLYSTSLYSFSNWTPTSTGSGPLTNISFTHNLVYNSGSGGYEPVHYNAIINGGTIGSNVIWNNGGTGIGLQTGVQNVSVTNNLVYSNSAAAITLSVYGCDNNGSAMTSAQATNGQCPDYASDIGVTYYPNMLNNISIVNNTFWTGTSMPPTGTSYPNYGMLVNDYSEGTPAGRWIKNLTIQNNIFVTFNDGTAYGRPIFEFFPNSYPDTDTIKNNLFYNGYAGNTQNRMMHIASNTDCTAKYAPYWKCTGSGAGTVSTGSAYSGDFSWSEFKSSYNTSKNVSNVWGDPLFTDAQTSYTLSSPNAFNFRVPSGSPANGAGQSSGAPTTDITGTVRSNPPTIGAFEAQ